MTTSLALQSCGKALISEYLVDGPNYQSKLDPTHLSNLNLEPKWLRETTNSAGVTHDMRLPANAPVGIRSTLLSFLVNTLQLTMFYTFSLNLGLSRSLPLNPTVHGYCFVRFGTGSSKSHHRVWNPSSLLFQPI